MKVILHIGLPKTGSSYIQEWLRINSTLVPSLSSESSSRLATACCDAMKFRDRSDFQSINNVPISLVKQHIFDIKKQNFDNFIISSEYFYLANPIDIKRIFDSFGLEVEKIVCFLRRQDDLIASGYAQDVKALARTEPFDLRMCVDVYDWLDLQSDYKSAFPDADFVPLEFDYLRKNGKLLSSWKDQIGCNLNTTDDIPGGNIINVSLPGDLVEICRLSNLSGDRIITDFSIFAAEHGILNSSYRLPGKIREEIKDIYSKRNDIFVSSLKSSVGFESYVSENWEIDDKESSGCISPELVCRLLRFAITEFSGGSSMKIVTPHGHGHGFRGKKL